MRVVVDRLFVTENRTLSLPLLLESKDWPMSGSSGLLRFVARAAGPSEVELWCMLLCMGWLSLQLSERRGMRKTREWWGAIHPYRRKTWVFNKIGRRMLKWLGLNYKKRSWFCSVIEIYWSYAGTSSEVSFFVFSKWYFSTFSHFPLFHTFLFSQFSDNPKYGNFSGIPHSLNEIFFVTLGKNRAPVVCSPRVT